MTRIPVNRVRRSSASGPRRTTKTPEQLAKEREKLFKRSGCEQQFPECPEVPDYEHKECKDCPFFPEKLKTK